MEPSLKLPYNARKSQEPIKINIKSDGALSVSSCTGIVEELMKYILYQRCQIPVPFDALEREVRLQRRRDAEEREAQITDSQAQQDSQSSSIRLLDQSSRKKAIMKQKLQRKRQQWLHKVEKFLQNFDSIRESLHNELKSGNVQGVNIILGSSVMTGRESYFIKLPEGYSCHSSAQLPKANHTGLKLFRSLITNEALLKVMNRPCGVQRIWVMVQKSSCSPLHDSITMENEATSANLIPRPGYSQSLRVTAVEINVQHTCVDATMDLTPTVGSGIKLHNLGIKRSLYVNSPSVSQYYSYNSNQDTLPCCYQRNQETNTGESYSDKSKMLPPSLSLNLDSTYNRPILETPFKFLKTDVIPVVETPVHSSIHKMESITPSKELASQLRTFKLSDNLDTLWYQIDCLLSGFRDMCMRS